MDRFQQLAAFVRTAERGSQAAAAPELGITPAMVGRQIRALEDRMGARLLNRTTATQSLTDAGASFYAEASAILDQLEAAEHAAAAGQAEPRGVLRLNAPMVFGVRYLAALVASFATAHPGLRVDLVLNDRVVDLVEEGYDAAIRIGRLPESSLVARRLARCRLLVCATPAYLARTETPKQPGDLRAHNVLTYAYAPAGKAWRFHGPSGTQAVHLDGNLVANNGDALLAACLAGAGVVVQPSFIVGDALRSGLLVPLLPGWRLDDLAVNAVYPSARNLPPKVRRLVDTLAGAFGDPPPWDAGLA